MRVGRSTHAVPATAGSVCAISGGSEGLARHTVGCKCLCPHPPGHQKQRGLPSVGALLPGDVLLLAALPRLVRQLAALSLRSWSPWSPASSSSDQVLPEPRGGRGRQTTALTEGTPRPVVLSPFSSRKAVNTDGKWSVAVMGVWGAGRRLPLPPRASERMRSSNTKNDHVSVLLRLPACLSRLTQPRCTVEKRLCLVSLSNVTTAT